MDSYGCRAPWPLNHLDSDAERAAERYEALQRRIEMLFRLWGSPSNAVELADRTLDRLARKVAEGADIPDGADGTSGFIEEELAPQNALQAGQRAVLFAPTDLDAFRLNIGVRTLGNGATIDIEVSDVNGVPRLRSTRTFPAEYFVQMSAADFIGTAVESGDSITIQVRSGSLIAYGATTDNRTNDPSVQFARMVP